MPSPERWSDEDEVRIAPQIDVTCNACGRASLEGGLCPNCLNVHSQMGRTFAELRQLLGLGPRRLKVLLWLKQHPELEEGAWKFEGNVGGSGSVKIGAMQMLEV